MDEKSIGCSCLRDFFKIKRGVATGANHFFVLSEETLKSVNFPPEYLRPILPSPRCMTIDKIEVDHSGAPLIENRLSLLSCNLSEERIKGAYPDLWNYLQQGIKEKINERYICRHRLPWYSQEYRPPAPLLFNIIGRVTNGKRKPYRFILNKSLAIATNNYLMLYPKEDLKELMDKNPELLELVWQVLNEITTTELLANGRVYGGDMYKLEPNELGQVNAEPIEKLLLNYRSIKHVSDYFREDS